MNPKRRAVSCLQGMCLLIALCFPTMANANQPLTDLLDSLEQAVASGTALSVRGALVQGGDITEFSFGRLAPDGGAAPDGDSAYQIGSITKVFTHLLLAEMVARGKLRYETTIADLLSDEIVFADPAVGEITLLQLATHTSGLPRVPFNLMATDLTDPYANYNEQQLLTALARIGDAQVLSNQQTYSNFGAGLLGYLLGRVDGSSYGQALSAHVLEPLGLNHTGMAPTGRVASPWAGHEVVPAWTFDALAGAGALWSTTSDLVRLAQAVIGARLPELKQDVVAGLEVVVEIGDGLSVSPVWHIAETEAGPVYWHNGGTQGNTSFLGIRPATKEALIVLLAGELDATAAALGWFGFSLAAVEDTREGIEMDRQALQAYPGEYAFAPGVALTIRLQGEVLEARLGAQPFLPMIPQAVDIFFFRDVDAELHFERDSAGEIVALILHQDGMQQRAERVR